MSILESLMRRQAAQLATLNPVQRSRNRFEVRIIFWGFVVHTLVQLTYINCPPFELFQRVLSIFALAALWLFPLLLPSVWEPYRAILVSSFKIVFFTFPNLRKPAGVQNALNWPASTHSLGFLVDMIRMTWAARLVAVYIFGIALPVSPLPQALVQLYCTACVRANPTLCGSQLMQDPLMAGRLRRFVLLTAAAVPPAAAVGASVPFGAECSFSYSFLALIVGVVVPTLPEVIKRIEHSPLEQHCNLGTWWVGVSAAWVGAAVVTSLCSDYF